MAKCNSCDLEITGGAKFCEHCGAPVSPIVPSGEIIHQEDHDVCEAKMPNGGSHPPPSQVSYQNNEYNQQQSPKEEYQHLQDSQQSFYAPVGTSPTPTKQPKIGNKTIL